jgi:hypothetical protein
MLLTIYDPQGHEAETPNCRVDSRATLRQTGIYQLVINTFDGGPGQYHFVFQGGTVK